MVNFLPISIILEFLRLIPIKFETLKPPIIQRGPWIRIQGAQRGL
jgi:hypothetical protein